MSLTSHDNIVLANARIILKREINDNTALTSAKITREFVQLSLATNTVEKFAVLFLDTQNRLIELKVLATGTIDSCTVYPRDIAKHALLLDSTSIIICHNHPSGNLTPSEADKNLTRQVEKAMELIQVKVLDHIIVSLSGSISFAELGLMGV